MASFSQSIVIAVLRVQGRKKRWADGATLVATARAERREGPTAAPTAGSDKVTLTTHTVAGFAVHTIRPRLQNPAAPTVLFLHGGGYIHDFATWHWRYLTKIVERTGATVLAAQYPLAPEHTWRDSFDALLSIARTVDVVMGDSAGGGYALALAQRLAAEGIARDAVLIAPALDMTMSDPDTARYDARDPWLATDGVLHCGRAWAGGDDPARIEVSPLFGELAGLGRVLVFTGTRDVLHPQALDLARRLPGLELVIAPGCVHNYPILPITEARAALETLAQFLAVER